MSIQNKNKKRRERDYSILNRNMNQPTPAQQEEYLQKVRQQMQATMMQEVMNKMSEKCFKVTYIIIY
jgi:hypothetical protein